MTARMVYLICEERDRKAAIALRRHLKEDGLEVQIPVFEGGSCRCAQR
ncbi:MAG: hypothetical protein MZW92_60860 [Comamonadaceae bacterium]|nr:hypothetical protein [Comamonadaceae bacterium]